MIAVNDGSWTPVRKDFVEPGTRCRQQVGRGRHHGFGNGQAFILRDGQGHEYPFGEACARAVLAEPDLLYLVPDYTERDAGQPVPEATAPDNEEFEAAGPAAPRARGAARGGRQGKASDAALRRTAAIRYLVLRMEKVASVPRVQPTVRFPALEAVYQAYLETGELPDAQVKRILAIERSATTPPKLKTINLLDVYTAHVKLERVIQESNRVEQRRFLRSIHDWLARHLVLSAAQIAAAGIQMHPHAFRSLLLREAVPADAAKGEKGEKGEKGDMGAKGEKGAKGGKG
ncbi:hypothetical protein [Cupriavidus basilensis]|uniref:hypothetical protein n=1 Tax=Cupriavidus basilensis TaxID=68895 RepID=UPI0020A64666|nr:hypothetical protein [Cupriavidus basilensis]MCP3018690.1 hypothetical protein [Cupriavidus basilensis]